MNVVGREDTRSPKVTDAESELLSYIQSSDGDKCPFHDSCSPRLSGKLCPCEVLGHALELLDSGKSILSDYDFIQLAAYNRPFRLVETMADKYLHKGKVRTPPVSSQLISLIDEQRPIEVRLIPLRCHHGATWYLDGEWVIQLSLNDTPLVRRLTLFHEAFHILTKLTGTRQLTPYMVKKGRFSECLAEYFSLYLLMPTRWVRDLWQQTRDLDRMALIFAVPIPIIYMRLKHLHLL